MRVLILSDIHANLAALESVLDAAKGRYDTIWCLGDIVGYGPRPNECVAIIRDRASLCVMGNHDWAVLGRTGLSVDDFNPHARQAVLWTRATLTEENMAFLAQLVDKPLRPAVEQSLLITHASPREPVSEYIMTPSIALENFALFEESICLVGHTHKPVIYRWRLHGALNPQPAGAVVEMLEEDEESPQEILATVDCLQPPVGRAVQLAFSERLRLIINPGSVGQPRDNDVRAAYAILDLARMTWCYDRAVYPIELTQSQMHAANLPRRLIDRLGFGW